MGLDKSQIALIAINTVVFIVFTTYAVYILARYKFKFDKAVIITIIAYIVSFLIRCANWVLNSVERSQELSNYFIFPDLVSTFIVLLIQQYFVFEMRIVCEKLETDNQQEFAIKSKRTYRIRDFMFVLATFVFIVSISIQMTGFFFDSEDINLLDAPFIIFVVLRVIRFLMDLFVFYQACKYFSYFLKKKLEKMALDKKKVTIYHKLVISWSVFILVANLIDIIGIFILGMLIPLAKSKYTTIYELLVYQEYMWFPLRHFLTAMTMLYLFHHQARLSHSKARVKNRNSLVEDDTEMVKFILENQSITGGSQRGDNGSRSRQPSPTLNTEKQLGQDGGSQNNDLGSVNKGDETKSWAGSDSFGETSQFRSFLLSQVREAQKKIGNYEQFKKGIFPV